METTLPQLNEETLSAPTQSTISVCLNCKQPTADKFCGNCGQPQTVKRITFTTLAADVYDRLFAMDNKFARTTIYLFKNPGYVISEILNGNRVKFFGAAGFYFLLLTLYLLLMSLFDISLQELTASTQEAVTAPDATQKQIEFGRKASDLMFKNFRIFGFLMIPFFSWGLMILYRKAKLNFFEHTVAVFYAFSFGMVVNIISLCIYYFSGYNSQMYLAVISILVYAYVISNFYHKQKILGFFKGLLAYVLGYAFFMIAIMLVMIAIVIADPSIMGL